MIDVMDFPRRSQRLDSPIMAQTLAEVAEIDFAAFTADDVRQALRGSQLGVRDFAALLSPAAGPLLEDLAQAAKRVTRANFGTSINLFTPLYVANYCANVCTYCGFSAINRIRRAVLDPVSVDRELRAIADSGLEEVLILTGESEKFSGVGYLAEVCRKARELFRTVSIEVHPLDEDGYRQLRAAGVDQVITYQETYDPIRYGQVHTGGRKRSFVYRFQTQERALLAGMRAVGFGALLGLADFRRDALAAGVHASLLQRAYPAAEISLGCPRLRPTVADRRMGDGGVGQAELFQVLCAYRLFLPFAGITVSTRETARFRDHAMGVVATKVSAGVSTGVGGHVEDEGDQQFEISDSRTVSQMRAAIAGLGLQAVFNDHVMV